MEDTGQKTLAHVTQQAEEQIKRNLEWFKFLPLLHDISESDKRVLSRSAWIELMLINLTKQSLQLDNGVLLCKGQVLDFSTAEVTGIGDIMHRVMQLTAKFKELNLDDAEFVCIKVIVLLNPGRKIKVRLYYFFLMKIFSIKQLSVYCQMVHLTSACSVYLLTVCQFRQLVIITKFIIIMNFVLTSTVKLSRNVSGDQLESLNVLPIFTENKNYEIMKSYGLCIERTLVSVQWCLLNTVFTVQYFSIVYM